MQRSTHEYLRSLNACTTILDMAAAGIQSLDDAAGDLLDIVCQSFGEPDITGIVVLMLPAERPIIAQVRAPKSHQRHVYHREPMNRGLLNVVLQTRQPALATNIRRACPDGYVAYDPVIESEIAVPLIVNEHVMGGNRCR